MQMRVQDVMSPHVITVSAEESVEVAARMLSRYNVGSVPVCGPDRKLRGVLTDRDIVLRCVAAGENPARMQVREIMTSRVVSVKPEDPAVVASSLMAHEQVRRLPVTRDGRVVGMVSLGDIASVPDYSMEAADALSEICNNVQNR